MFQKAHRSISSPTTDETATWVQEALVRSESPGHPRRRRRKVKSTGGSPHNTGCREHSPDRDESSPITWRGSGESRLAPLRVVLLTRGVQRVSVRNDSPARRSQQSPFRRTTSPLPATRPVRRLDRSPARTSSSRRADRGYHGRMRSDLGFCPMAQRSHLGRPVRRRSGRHRSRRAAAAPRSLCRSERLSGIAGSRYSWCSRSSVAVSSNSGRPVRAATSKATCRHSPQHQHGVRRSAVIRAPPWSALRLSVHRRLPTIPRPGPAERPGRSPSVQAIVNPPSTAAATLSGCPSISCASATIRSRSTGCSGPVRTPPRGHRRSRPRRSPDRDRAGSGSHAPQRESRTDAPSAPSPARIERTTRVRLVQRDLDPHRRRSPNGHAGTAGSHDQFVVQGEREAEGVETWAEVRACRRDPYADLVQHPGSRRTADHQTRPATRATDRCRPR